MSELLELLNNSSRCFYLGLDNEAWLFFSKLIESIQRQLMTNALDDGMTQELMTLVVQLDQIEALKTENNYTVIADILYNAHNHLMKLRS